ncbi:MAG: phage repressor protein [Peptococcaceae bacterium]|nr:phage repressor protein [Peptococcaceae bacterium]
MKTLRTEAWDGHDIRFVEIIPGDWWAVLADIAGALGLTARFLGRRLSKDVLSKHPLDTPGGQQEMLIVNEFGIYEAIFESRKPEAKTFKRWTFEVLKTLRRTSGLESFHAFRMLDKMHQCEAMRNLSESLNDPSRVDYIKANTIANKAVSSIYGHPKMIKKSEMTPEMLATRQPILADTVSLMTVNDSFGLKLSVSDAVYGKYHRRGCEASG